MADAATDTPDIAGSTPAPEKDDPLDRVDEMLRDHWGLSGQIFPVEEARGIGYLVDNGHLRYFLDIRPPEDEAALQIEHEVMRHIIRSPDGPPVCEPVVTRSGADIVTASVAGEQKVMRLLTVLEGSASGPSGALSAMTGVSLAMLAAGLAKSLEDFDQKAWDGEHEDDLRKAGPRTVSLLSELTDQEARDFIARAMVAALRRIHPLTPNFRLGLTIPDLAPDILTGEGDEGEWRATGITDLGGLAKIWHVSALAKTCARILFSRAGEPASVLPAVAAYHAVDPLNGSEIEALWPLVIADIALTAAIAENYQARNRDNEQAGLAAEQAREVLRTASATTAAFMHGAILDACGVEPAALNIGPLLRDIDIDRIRVVDLGVTSPLFYDGNWTDPDCDWKLLARIAWETGMGSTRYGEYRLSRSSMPGPDAEPGNVALHVDICLPAGTMLAAPFAGTVTQTSPRLSIRGRDVTLLLEGIVTDLSEGSEVEQQAVIGRVAGEEASVGGIRIRLCRDPDNAPPLFCTPSEAAIWRHLAPSPATMLRIDCDAPPVDEQRPGRAWREFVYDEAGHIQLDFGGTTPLVGHGHPAVATASYRQHLLIAASHRDVAGSQALRQALFEIAPPGLGNVLLFTDRNSALTAIEAALSLPQDAAAAEIDGLEEEDPTLVGVEPEALVGDEETETPQATGIVVIEPLPGLPDLGQRVEEASKQHHLVVIDETRTGYGRLGDTCWAVEHRGIVADVLLAGSCDGGALAVVFSSDDLADRLAAFVSPVSPVAAATALAALTAVRDEHLQANAAAMGELLGQGLRQLAEESNGIIEVSGHGLFWEIQPKEEQPDTDMRLGQAISCMPDDTGRLLLLPPLCVSEASIRHCLEHLRETLGRKVRAEI